MDSLGTGTSIIPLPFVTNYIFAIYGFSHSSSLILCNHYFFVLLFGCNSHLSCPFTYLASYLSFLPFYPPTNMSLSTYLPSHPPTYQSFFLSFAYPPFYLPTFSLPSTSIVFLPPYRLPYLSFFLPSYPITDLSTYLATFPLTYLSTYLLTYLRTFQNA